MEPTNISKNKFLLIFIFIFLCFNSLAISQSKVYFKFRKIEYISKGKTNPEIVKQKTSSFDISQQYSSVEEIESILIKIKQELENTRLLSDISYSYSLASIKENDVQLIDAIISFNDTKSLVIIPRPSIDSNSGTALGIAIQDQNFLGLMNPIKFSFIGQLGTEDDPNNLSKVSLGGNFSYSYPFSIGLTRNSWLNSFKMGWTIDEGKPDFSATSGIDIGIPIGNNYLKIDFLQSIINNTDFHKYNDELYFQEKFKISLPLLIGLLNNKSKVIYNPFLQITYNWDRNGINAQNTKLKKTPELTIGHTTNIDGVNWDGNFRNGYFMSTTQSIAKNFNSSDIEEMFTYYLKATASIYKNYAKIIGIEASINFFSIVNSFINIGPNLRGILDKQTFSSNYNIDEDNLALETTTAFTFNFGVPIHIITTDWIGWFNISNLDSGFGKILSYLNFELQISPFLDVGLLKNRATGKYFNLSEGLYAGGFELILYPEKWKSYAIRASIGFDLSKYKEWRTPNKNYELFLGVGHLF